MTKVLRDELHKIDFNGGLADVEKWIDQNFVSKVEEDSSCHHQWFEIDKLSKLSENQKRNMKEMDKKISDWENLRVQGKVSEFMSNPYLYSPILDMRGILVKCANCYQQQELWEDEK